MWYTRDNSITYQGTCAPPGFFDSMALGGRLSPPSPTRVFLDMDGVIVDFNRGAYEAHGRADPYLTAGAWGKCSYEEVWDMTPGEFWRPLDTPYFWRDLHPTREVHEIVERLTSRFGVENIAILSDPAMSKYCIPGKREWINTHFPQFHNRIIFAPPGVKQFFAHNGALLVDDRDSNVEE